MFLILRIEIARLGPSLCCYFNVIVKEDGDDSAYQFVVFQTLSS
jgi:hypothetical protein